MIEIEVEAVHAAKEAIYVELVAAVVQPVRGFEVEAIDGFTEFEGKGEEWEGGHGAGLGDVRIRD
jgi:hypothetical protein